MADNPWAAALEDETPKAGANPWGEALKAEGATPPAVAPEKPGVLGRFADRVSGTVRGIANTVAGGAKAAGEVLSDLPNVPGNLVSVAQNPSSFFRGDYAEPAARRRQLERGVDDMLTLGHGQRIAARVGNALGDAPASAIGPETFGKTGPGIFANGGAPVANTQEADAATAPEFRQLGQVIGMGAGRLGGAQRAASMAGEAGVNAITRGIQAASTARKVGLGAARGALTYGTTAPVLAGLAADNEGRRLEAAQQAATDPVGLLLSGGGGAAAEGGAGAVNASRGAEARRFIEGRGEGAHVGIGTPGAGGVFEGDLAGVKATDAGIGEAAKIGARKILDRTEQKFQDEHGFEYRGAKDATTSVDETRASALKSAKEAIADAERDRVRALKEAQTAIKVDAAERGQAIVDRIAEDHKVETSRPYRVMREMIDAKPEAHATRDVGSIVQTMQDAAYDLSTAPEVRSQLEGELKILDRYRDKKTDAIMVPEYQINGLRQTLMRSAKIGMSDNPGGKEAPLRAAAFAAKQMVDQGPYAALNKFYAEGARKLSENREAVGLKSRPGKEISADVKRLQGALRKSVVEPETAPEGLAAEMDQHRQALDEIQRRMDETRAKAEAGRAEAEQAAVDAKAKIAAATGGEEADRARLGLNTKIGTRKTDTNQVRLALERQGRNSTAAGGSTADLESYRAAHPEAGHDIDLPELARARADLAFHLIPHHGGLKAALATAGGYPLAAALTHALPHGALGALALPAILALQNATPLAGRALYPLAQKVGQSAPAAGAALARALQEREREGR